MAKCKTTGGVIPGKERDLSNKRLHDVLRNLCWKDALQGNAESDTQGGLDIVMSLPPP